MESPTTAASTADTAAPMAATNATAPPLSAPAGLDPEVDCSAMESPTTAASTLDTAAPMAATNATAPPLSAPAGLDPEVAAIFGKQKQDVTKKKRSRSRMSNGEKVDSVYESIDVLKTVHSLLCVTLRSTQSALNNASQLDAILPLNAECLSIACNQLEMHLKSISLANTNTSAKKGAASAHTKVIKKKKKELANQLLMKNGVGSDTPVGKLTVALNNTKETLALHSLNSNSTNASVPQTNSNDDDVVQNPPQKKSKDDDEEKVVLPPLSPGLKLYTPQQVVGYIVEEQNRRQNQGKPGISYLRRMKDAMIEQRRVPCKITRLNNLIRDHGKEGQPEAPLFWHNYGRPEIMTVDELKSKFLEHQQRTGKLWNRSDTKSALIDALKGIARRKNIDPSSVKEPVAITVDTYHSALMSDPAITLRAGKEKGKLRDVGETSVRSMLANAAGILACSAVIGDVPEEFRFVGEGAGEGLLLARSLVAEAHGVPIESVHFLRPGLRCNIDDMACVYSIETGFSVEETEYGLVLKDNVNGNQNRIYNPHSSAKFTTKFTGVKGRHTNMLFDDGSLGPIWLQFPGLSEEEMPVEMSPNGVVVMVVEGLTHDGNINPHSDAVGYVVFMRKGQGVETEMFKEFERLARKPTGDKKRFQMGINPNDPIPSWGRAVITKDGGITQLNATINEESFADKDSRNETDVKLSKQTSGVFQPCDTGDGHAGQRRGYRKLRTEPVPDLDIGKAFDKAIQGLQDNGILNLNPHKVGEMRGMVVRAPSVSQIAYSKKKVMASFTVMGWLDEETIQGPDVLKLFKSLKRAWTTDERDKWLRDLPSLIGEIIHFGIISEKKFQDLGYPVDTDDGGLEFPLNSSVVTQLHRQRFAIPNHSYLQHSLLEQCEKANEVAMRATEQEMALRDNILEMNELVERRIHSEAGRSPDSHRSVFAQFPPTLDILCKLKGKELTPFVHARVLTSSEVPKGKNVEKIPTRVGNKQGVLATLEKIQQNPSYKPIEKEDSLLLKASQVCSFVDLKLKVDDCVELEDDAETNTDITARPHQSMIVEASSSARPSSHSFMGDDQLFQEARRCLDFG